MEADAVARALATRFAGMPWDAPPLLAIQRDDADTLELVVLYGDSHPVDELALFIAVYGVLEADWVALIHEGWAVAQTVDDGTDADELAERLRGRIHTHPDRFEVRICVVVTAAGDCAAANQARDSEPELIEAPEGRVVDGLRRAIAVRGER